MPGDVQGAVVSLVFDSLQRSLVILCDGVVVHRERDIAAGARFAIGRVRDVKVELVSDTLQAPAARFIVGEAVVFRSAATQAWLPAIVRACAMHSCVVEPTGAAEAVDVPVADVLRSNISDVPSL